MVHCKGSLYSYQLDSEDIVARVLGYTKEAVGAPLRTALRVSLLKRRGGYIIRAQVSGRVRGVRIEYLRANRETDLLLIRIECIFIDESVLFGTRVGVDHYCGDWLAIESVTIVPISPVIPVVLVLITVVPVVPITVILARLV
jgi:hypothetical protein